MLIFEMSCAWSYCDAWPNENIFFGPSLTRMYHCSCGGNVNTDDSFHSSFFSIASFSHRYIFLLPFPAASSPSHLPLLVYKYGECCWYIAHSSIKTNKKGLKRSSTTMPRCNGDDLAALVKHERMATLQRGGDAHSTWRRTKMACGCLHHDMVS
jgi:hypothetical protein